MLYLTFYNIAEDDWQNPRYHWKHFHLQAAHIIGLHVIWTLSGLNLCAYYESSYSSHSLWEHYFILHSTLVDEILFDADKLRMTGLTHLQMNWKLVNRAPVLLCQHANNHVLLPTTTIFHMFEQPKHLAGRHVHWSNVTLWEDKQEWEKCYTPGIKCSNHNVKITSLSFRASPNVKVVFLEPRDPNDGLYRASFFRCRPDTSYYTGRGMVWCGVVCWSSCFQHPPLGVLITNADNSLWFSRKSTLWLAAMESNSNTA